MTAVVEHLKSKPFRQTVFRIILYILLIDISFVLLYPLLYILVNSFKTFADFMDPTVLWVPTKLYTGNYEFAFQAMNFWTGLKQSLLITIPPAVFQLVTCAITGYVFARYEFPFKGWLFAIVLLSFIIPPQTIAVSTYMLFARMKWLNTIYPFIVPALFAQGLRGALFIIIFRQFFKGLPWELEDAARVDGAGAIRTFTQIMVPMAIPAMLVVFLFSVVWHWNDYFQPLMYLHKVELFPLPMRVTQVNRELEAMLGSAATGIVN